MNDKKLLNLISSGAVTPSILSNQLNISIEQAQSIFKDLENKNLIYLNKIPLRILNKLTPSYKEQYELTELGVEVIEN